MFVFLYAAKYMCMSQIMKSPLYVEANASFLIESFALIDVFDCVCVFIRSINLRK